MAAAVWTECINLTVLQKKSGAPAKSGALLFYGLFLRGVLGKVGVSAWFFVVKLWWIAW
jgi:hypothetical protein